MSPLQLAFDFFADLIPLRAPREKSRPRRRVTESPREKPLYELHRHPRRRRLGIEVHPDLRVIVRAPVRCPAIEIEWFVAERREWIAAQLDYFRQHPPATVPTTGADGEYHAYLGQRYRLTLRPEAPLGVYLDGDCIIVGGASTEAERVQSALAAWVRAQALREFSALIDQWHVHPRFARYPRPALTIRLMRTRWGSLGSGRGMTLNLALIRAPHECIEYVVVHELCHLRYHGHGRGFYALLEAVLPDWRARRKALEASVR